MAIDLKEIEKQLQEHAQELERRRMDAHTAAMKELAYMRTQEEERQAAAKKASEEANEKAERSKAKKAEAEAERLRDEENLRRATEAEENKKVEAADRIAQARERISKQMAEMEHAEEQAKKQLRDLILNNSAPEPAPTGHPLGKFLQKTPE
jgi:hypothetical protein